MPTLLCHQAICAKAAPLVQSKRSNWNLCAIIRADRRVGFEAAITCFASGLQKRGRSWIWSDRKHGRQPLAGASVPFLLAQGGIRRVDRPCGSGFILFNRPKGREQGLDRE